MQWTMRQTMAIDSFSHSLYTGVDNSGAVDTAARDARILASPFAILGGCDGHGRAG